MAMPDDVRLGQVVRDLGIPMEDVADRCGVDKSCASTQLSGQRPMQGPVKAAFLAAQDAEAAALPHVALLLGRHREDGAAEACRRPSGQPDPTQAEDPASTCAGSTGTVV